MTRKNVLVRHGFAFGHSDGNGRFLGLLHPGIGSDDNGAWTGPLAPHLTWMHIA